MEFRKCMTGSALILVLAVSVICAETTETAALSRPPESPRVPVSMSRDIPISRIKKVTSTTVRGNWWGCEKAVDGYLDTPWSCADGALAKEPQSLTVELDAAYTVDALRYFLAHTPQEDPKREYVNWIGRIQKYEAALSMDGKTFQTVASGIWEKTDYKEQRITFPPTEARYVRLIALAADRLWCGGVPELLISGPGMDKQAIPSTWLMHKKVNDK